MLQHGTYRRFGEMFSRAAETPDQESEALDDDLETRIRKVYDSLDDVLGHGIWQNFHYSAGVGFRGIVPPSFVGRLDIALGGGEGVGVFVGLDYPW